MKTPEMGIMLEQKNINQDIIEQINAAKDKKREEIRRIEQAKENEAKRAREEYENKINNLKEEFKDVLPLFSEDWIDQQDIQELEIEIPDESIKLTKEVDGANLGPDGHGGTRRIPYSKTFFKIVDEKQKDKLSALLENDKKTLEDMGIKIHRESGGGVSPAAWSATVEDYTYRI